MADSPLSDDSLSSIGASTEPLPASDGPAMSPSSPAAAQTSSPPPRLTSSSRKKSNAGNGGGHESDSTLTEQSSSEGRGGGRDDDDVDEDLEEAEEPTPKAKSKRIGSSSGQTGRSRPESVDGIESELSEAPAVASDADDQAGSRTASPKPPSISYRNPTHDEIEIKKEQQASASTSLAPTRNATFSDLDLDEDDPRRAELENDVLSSASDREDDADHQAPATIATASATATGKKAAARSRAPRGRSRAPLRGAAARGSKKRAATAKADSAGEQDTGSVDGGVPEPSPNVKAPARKRAGRAAPASRSKAINNKSSRAAAAVQEASRSPSPASISRLNSPATQDIANGEQEPLASASASASTSSSGRGMKRTRDDAEAEAALDNATSELEKDAATEKAVLDGIDGLVANLAGAPDELKVDESLLKAQDDAMVVDTPAEQAHSATEAGETEDPVEDDAEEREPTPPPVVSNASKKSKKGNKKGSKGKEKAVVQEVPDEEEVGTPAASDHEEDSDDVFIRRRSEAMEALTKIEIAFARLRDRLYIERMAEVEQERIGVETGTHPELIQLNHLIELRRTKKLELARKWLDGLEGGYGRHLAEQEHAIWTWWTNERADLRTSMMDESNSKRRRLEREKIVMDRPKEDTLGPLLAPKQPPAVPLSYHRTVGYEVQNISESEIIWALRQHDARADASVSGLDDESTLTDLEMMGLRGPEVRAELYSYAPVYALPPQAAYSDPHAGSMSMSGPYAYSPAYDTGPMSMAPSSHFASPFAPIVTQQQPSPPSHTPASTSHNGTFSREMGMGPTPTRNLPPSSQPPYPSYTEYSHQSPWQPPSQQSHQHQQQKVAPLSAGVVSAVSASPFSADGSGGQRRARTPSNNPNNGSGGLGDSLDIVAAQRERPSINGPGGLAGASDDGGHKSSLHPNAGTTGGGSGSATTSNHKHRPSLDDHMAFVRSPKAPASSAATSSTTATIKSPVTGSGLTPSGKLDRASFMSIPVIPPFRGQSSTSTAPGSATAARNSGGGPQNASATGPPSSMPQRILFN